MRLRMNNLEVCKKKDKEGGKQHLKLSAFHGKESITELRAL